jgi:hypothetical protein
MVDLCTGGPVVPRLHDGCQKIARAEYAVRTSESLMEGKKNAAVSGRSMGSEEIYIEAGGRHATETKILELMGPWYIGEFSRPNV